MQEAPNLQEDTDFLQKKRMRKLLMTVLVLLVLSPYLIAFVYRVSGFWADYRTCSDINNYIEYDNCRQTIEVRSGAGEALETFNILYSTLSLVSLLAGMSLIFITTDLSHKRSLYSKLIAWGIISIITINILAIFLFGPPSGGVLTPEDIEQRSGIQAPS